MTKLRVLVVDDSTLFRKVVRDVLAKHPQVEVVGSAVDGRQALEKIAELRPDLVTLDMQMPQLDGIEVLRALRSRGDRVGVLMLSSLTDRGARETIQALEQGAFDFILKPQASDFDRSLALLESALFPKIDAWLSRTGQSKGVEPVRACPLSHGDAARSRPVGGPFGRPRLVAIGISTGGPSALTRLIPRLDADFPAPIAIVQHMPPMFTRSLAEDLARQSRLAVVEGEDGMPVRRGSVYIAPGGRQMRLRGTVTSPVIEVTDDAPEKNCRPSVDYLFRSVASLFAADAVACVMTGMGDDGAAGCAAIRRAGGQVIAQDQSSCTVYGMPRAVIEGGLADEICPLDDLADALARAAGMRGVSCR